MDQIIHLLPIAATGIVAVTIIIERVGALFFKFSVDSKLFLGQVESLLAQGNLQGALDLCASNEKAPLARVVKAGLLKAAREESEVKSAMDVALLDNSGSVTKRIGYLAMLANVATLLGLLGTIAGLISSFKAVASADAATKQSLLADGISVAMNATALGLVVAVMSLVAFSLLNGRANRILDELEKGAARTFEILRGRIYSSDEDDFSKVTFEGVKSSKELKGAA